MARCVQSHELLLVERGDDQQHRVGARRTRLEQLVLVHDEVLAQERNLHRAADGGEVLERAIEERRLGQHRDGRRASGLVLRAIATGS